jgi:hypothetical protein
MLSGCYPFRNKLHPPSELKGGKLGHGWFEDHFEKEFIWLIQHISGNLLSPFIVINLLVILSKNNEKFHPEWFPD